MIDWMELENQIGLEALPAFHRAFLVLEVWMFPA